MAALPPPPRSATRSASTTSRARPIACRSRVSPPRKPRSARRLPVRRSVGPLSLRSGAMGLADYDIDVAAQDDIAGTLELQERNLRSNGGALSVPFSAEWFELAITDM